MSTLLEIIRVGAFPTVLLAAVYLLSFGIGGGSSQPDQGE